MNTASAADWSICSRWAPRCPTVSSCSTTKSRPCAALMSIRNARFTRCLKSVCCPPVSFPAGMPAAPSSVSAFARRSRAMPRASAFTRMSPAASCRPASSITCRCFSSRPRHCLITCRPPPPCYFMATCPPPLPNSGSTPKAATRCWGAIARARYCRQTTFFCVMKSSLSKPMPLVSSCKKSAPALRRPACHHSRLIARPTTRWRRCGLFWQRQPLAR